MVTAQPAKSIVEAEKIDLADVQGNILRGYSKARVRHLVMQVVDAGKARAWLGATVGDDRSLAPAITRAAHWGDRPPDVCFNLGITFAGMKALGVPESSVNSFPEEFRQGMAARALRLGDWGDSAPAHWHPWFQDADAVHLIVTLHAHTEELLDSFEAALMAGLAGRALQIRGRNKGARQPDGTVHFGYRDSISQPRFAGINKPGQYDDQPESAAGDRAPRIQHGV